MATNQDPEWTEFHVIEGRGGNCFRYPHDEHLSDNRPWACVGADSFWREGGVDEVHVIRGGVLFDSGTVTTTGRTRHFTGLERVAPPLGERVPCDMHGEHLTRLCADRFQVGDVLRVRYPLKLFLTRRRNIESSAWLK